ncbi:MAG: hypothetical protein HY975_03565 [Candidatus Kerfeldbacteria bacterium]|nr:hypothetical protein [Candidatus Kerfeldbacteria bacterium]
MATFKIVVYRVMNHHYARLVKPEDPMPSGVVFEVSGEAERMNDQLMLELVAAAKAAAKQHKLKPNDIIGLEDFRTAA